MRHERSFEAGYRPVEEQYRRTWQQKPGKKVRPPPKQPPPATQAQIKKLYRQLARKYHPDLAHNDADRAYRTQKMTAVNDAYKARSMVELMALAEELGKDIGVTAVSSPETEQTDSQMIQALEEELARCQRRLREIDNELNNFHNNSMVELALEVKFARREGRDVLAEMAAEVERQIARKTVERDMLKSQFTDLNRHRR
jgi:curved DNA-binding protein CbpA